MITREAIAHRAGLLAQENEMTHTPEEIELVAKRLQSGCDLAPWANIDEQRKRLWRKQAIGLIDALAALRRTPALDALAMQRAALKIVDPGYGDFHAGHYSAIAGLPAPSPEAALTEAQRLAPQIGVLAAERMKREAAEVALCHKAKVAVNEELWHEGQDWACQRINDAILALSTGYTAKQLKDEALAVPEVARLWEAAENLLIAIGMGWDLDGVAEVARAALLDLKGAAK